MFLFIDTEFTDFVNCDMMSFGAITEDGNHEFYVEINDYTLEYRSQFVIDNIVPLMDTATYGKSYKVASHNLADWVDSLPGDNLIVVADYHKDAHFMIDMLLVKPPKKKVSYMYITPAFCNMLNERGISNMEQELLAMRVMVQGIEDYFQTDPRQHHALVDAKANRYGWIKGYSSIVQGP